MKFNPKLHQRKSIRLKKYDYSQKGLYFVTVCLKNRKCLFGQIENKEMVLNDAGKMIQSEWIKIPIRFPNVRLHDYMVMPNHFHAIIEICVGATLVVAPSVNLNSANILSPKIVDPHHLEQQQILNGNNNKGRATTRVAPAVGDIVGAFKSITTIEYIRGINYNGWIPFNGKLWQRNYFDNIIRNQQSYKKITQYISNNPINWSDDRFYK